METTHLHIKNMCCERCVEVIMKLLKATKYKVISITLGELVLKGKISSQDRYNIEQRLKDKGFSLTDTYNEKLISKTKALLLQYRDKLSLNEKPVKISAFISNGMQMSFSHVSRIFSQLEEITVEKYLLLLRMEKAKELLIQTELSASEISDRLGYNSPQSFITQFKKEVGKTPGEYRLNPAPARIHLDKLAYQDIKQKKRFSKLSAK
ncbi:AraC family transcriptional regulator [Sediminibacterium sp.]|uniref:helix-turn-helix domain-containing protein n=1 Tax=Sediminibacterium sp. TaxID=1917865 RepID=UPI00272F9D67|nr:AraC family transcriptional regulator [Sediminibacterium sp.]MDP2421348.1 AraC family transcriptional regulator [Sediminibacterium sp.]